MLAPETPPQDQSPDGSPLSEQTSLDFGAFLVPMLREGIPSTTICVGLWHQRHQIHADSGASWTSLPLTSPKFDEANDSNREGQPVSDSLPKIENVFGNR
jgi:hypothetical protein